MYNSGRKEKWVPEGPLYITKKNDTVVSSMVCKMNELPKIEPIDIHKIHKCNICFDDVIKSRLYSLNCRCCKNFTMCICCFDNYISCQKAIYYKGVTNGRLSTKCPYCQNFFGFDYRNIMYRNYPEKPLLSELCFMDSMMLFSSYYPRNTHLSSGHFDSDWYGDDMIDVD